MRIFELLDMQYNRFIDASRNYLSKTLSGIGISFNNASVFGQLINVLNGAIQNLMLYIEDALVEQNKYTAQRKKSVYALAAQSGYKTSLGKASAVSLRLMFVPNNERNFNVLLNNHQQLVCTQNGLYYNIVLPQEAVVLSISQDNSARHIYAVQGKFENQSFAVQGGGRLYTENIRYQGNLDLDYVTVKVNNEVWERRDSLYDMEASAKQYTIIPGYNNGFDIMFGTGVHGEQLEDGDFVWVEYLVHDGEQGNLDSSQSAEFIFNEELQDINGSTIDGNAVFNVILASDDAITSGTDSESTEQVRAMIGCSSRAHVLASPENYKEFLNHFAFCGYNRTWTETGSLVVNSLIIANYKLNILGGTNYFDLKPSDFYLTNNQKQSIMASLEQSGRQLAGVSYNIFDPQLYRYALFLHVSLKEHKGDRNYINNRIRTIMADFFTNINDDKYIPKSDIVMAIKSQIPQIDGLDVYILSERNETALQRKEYTTKTYDYNPSKGTYEHTVKHVYLYDGENPQLGLDEHGNIALQSDEEFPVLMGGWDYLNNEGQEVHVDDPLIIIYKD